MKALITGASSGIGYSFAKELSSRGYDIIAVARGSKDLEKLKNELNTDVEIICMDLSVDKNCYKLYDMCKDKNVDILINNAGFGAFGNFSEIELDRELNMIDLNIKSLHILTKLFLKDMIKKDKGYILNVASIAGFMSGPLMATYYSTKAYVLRLSKAIYKELKKSKSNVKISCLCPGPVKTHFNDVAGVNFNVKPLTSDYVAKYAVKKMFKNKNVIIPGVLSKFIAFASKVVPDSIMLECAYKAQTMKID